ncbi:MAG: epoxyqueuosine reductase QueH [Lachnospiraceae bacterium]|nr:epoxyqueuosine reductase QueH [Lachnospiraceae bacterium]
MDVNIQKELDKKMKVWRDGNVHPSLLLHSCCAPCSSYCLTYLADVFDITLYFYNPNITEKSEYEHRLSELVRLVKEMPLPRKVGVKPGPWEPERFFEMSKGLENAPERGERCIRCYSMRLEDTARVARDMGTDFFATTLTLSPLKDSKVINAIGESLSDKNVRYLDTDFKKNGGYQKSIELSREYGLYRQNYCGCLFSKAQRMQKEKQGEQKETYCSGNCAAGLKETV